MSSWIIRQTGQHLGKSLQNDMRNSSAIMEKCWNGLPPKERWGQGIGSRAVQLFLPMVTERFRLQSMGAFVYSDNLPSLHLLQRNGFVVQERFVEDGRESVYLER